MRKIAFLTSILLLGCLVAAGQHATNSQKPQPQNQTPAPAANGTPSVPGQSQTTSPGTGSAATPQSDRGPSQKAEERLYKEVRHELVMLPNLSLWDNLAYKVEGYKVT